MNRNKLILGILTLIFLALLAFYAIDQKKSKSTLNINESAFSIKDTASVDKIFIASKFGWSALLEKRNNGDWFLNNQYKVNKGQLSILLKTLYWQRIKRPVHKGEREMVIKNIATKGSKVEIYQNGKKTKVFYVGGDANDAKGTYFIMEGSENPFVVYMPNHTGFLSPRYVVKEENYRNSQIFKSNLNSFIQIKVDYPANPSESFVIVNEDNRAKILGIENVNKTVLNNYISSYNRIFITRFIEDNDFINKIDSLSQYPPNVSISVQDKVSEFSNSIDIYLNEKDPDGMLGIATIEGDKKYVLIQNYVFDKLIIPASRFRAN
ncbi:hypothetical protein HZR84_02145 [Hyphobacterium sp. CCMP332]|nr:hypothetical protein HZR84_02145 [Hyphobacterium sp. CCMP332]